MISLFTRQLTCLRRGDHGQATVLLLTVISAILSVVLAAIHIVHLGSERVATANAVDAIALSAATWEARGLNLIAALNDGILQCLRLIRWTCVLWGAMAIAACSGVGLPAFLDYSRRSARVIRSSWKTAQQFAKWAGKIKAATPYLVLSETVALSGKLKVAGALNPFDPRGPSEHERTLELHLVRSAPLTLADALSPLTKVKKTIGKWKWARKIAKRIIGIIDSTLPSDMGSVTLLIPENHLPDRQRVRYTGFREVPPLPVPFLSHPSNKPLYGEAEAEVYGGGATEMTWAARMTEGRREKR